MCVLGVKQLHQHIDKGKEREGGREGGRGREGEGDQFNEWLSLGPPLPDLSFEIDFAAKELRSHTNHVISAQQLM